MSFSRPSLGQLISDAQSAINTYITNADSRLRRSVLNVLARVFAGLTDGLYSTLQALSRQFFATTATGEFLDEIGSSIGITRLGNNCASGSITINGASGTVIAYKSLLTAANGVEVYTIAEVTIPAAGTIAGKVIATTAGVDGNLAAGVALTLATSVDGVSSIVVGSDGLTDGAAAETDAAYRVRILQRLRNPPGAGTIADWQRWAKLLDASITRVWVLSAFQGNGTVGVVFAQDNLAVVPTSTAVALMQTHLESYEPAGSHVTAIAPTIKTIPFVFSMLDADSASTRLAVMAELDDLLYREGYPGNTIPLSHVRAAISAATGETDYVLTSPSGALSFGDEYPSIEIGAVGAITWPS